MPKKKSPQLTPKEQFKRFKDAAREHGVDLEGKEIEKVVKKVVRSKPPAAKR